MLTLKCYIWSTLAVFVILVPSPAPAQTVANSFEELRQVLKKGQTVVVTDASGQRTKGKVADVSPSSLVVRAEAMTRGKRITIGAGIGIGGGVGAVFGEYYFWRGLDMAHGPDMLLGAGIGASVGGFIAWASKFAERRTFAEGTVTEIRAADSLRSGALIGVGVGVGVGVAVRQAMCADNGPDCGAALKVGAASAGIGAAIGAGIDALVNKGGKVLYASPQQTRGVTLSPLLGKDRQGVLVSVRF